MAVPTPANVKVDRDGNTFKLSWKKPDGKAVGKVWVAFYEVLSDGRRGKRLKAAEIGQIGTTSASYTVPAANYYPRKAGGRRLKGVRCEVANHGAGGWSKTVAKEAAWPTAPAPTGIAVTRNGAKFSATWSKPDAKKVSDQKVEWLVKRAGAKSATVALSKYASKSAASASFTLDTSKYPHVESVTVRVTNRCIRGYAQASKAFGLAAPAAPRISFERRNGTEVWAVVECEDAPNRWFRSVAIARSMASAGAAGASYPAISNGSAENAFLLAASDSPAVPARYQVTATASSPGGSRSASTSRMVSIPNKPAVTGVRRLNDNGCIVSWKGNADSWHPVDAFDIEYADVDHSVPVTAAAINDIAGWGKAKSGVSAAAASAQTDELAPVAEGKRRHFRVRANHDGAWAVSDANVAAGADWGPPVGIPGDVTAQSAGPGALSVSWAPPENIAAGAAIQVFLDSAAAPKCTLGPTAASCTIEGIAGDGAHKAGVRVACAGQVSPIKWSDAAVVRVLGVTGLSAALREDGGVDLTWENAPSSTAANGITAAWSEHADAFISTEPPATADFEDGTAGIEDCDQCDHVIVYGLDFGKRYYFWLRKWHKGDGGTVYSDWVQAACATGGEALAVSTPPVSPGLGVSRTWAGPGRTAVQVQWSCVCEEGQGLTGTALSLRPRAGGAALRSWTYPAGQDSAEVDLAGLEPGEYELVCTMANAGGCAVACADIAVVSEPVAQLGSTSLKSDLHGAEGDDVPEEVEYICDALPLVFSCAGAGALTLTIRAEQNFELAGPGGTRRAYEGEAAFSRAVDAGTVEVADADLLDGGIYTARLVAEDPLSGLSAASGEVRFRVDWARKAQGPSGTAEANQDDLNVVVTPQPPEGAAAGDACDLYRVTSDGVALIARDAVWGEPYIDDYAAYNWEGCAVRIACRTPYGSEAWEDVPYGLSCADVRIDWPDGAVSLPYDRKMGDARSHSFEVRSYLSGERRAAINPALSRRATVGGSLFLDEDDALLPEIYRLSRWAGTCMVRTPEGQAFVAVADVDIDLSDDDAMAAVSFELAETDANGDYGAAPLDAGEGGGE